MSERQRVRGTAVDSWFCEARGNLVSNTVMPPFIPHNLENPFRVFRVFRGSLATFLEFIIQPRKSRKARNLICRPYKAALFLLAQPLKTYNGVSKKHQKSTASKCHAFKVYLAFFVLLLPTFIDILQQRLLRVGHMLYRQLLRQIDVARRNGFH